MPVTLLVIQSEELLLTVDCQRLELAVLLDLHPLLAVLHDPARRRTQHVRESHDFTADAGNRWTGSDVWPDELEEF